jgi:hypothetical protein
MEKREGLEDFSLLWGPLHRLGCRLGLVSGGTNTVALGLVLGAFAEVIDSPLVVLNHFWLRSLFNQFARKIVSD